MKDKIKEFIAYTDASSFNNGRKIPYLPEHSCSAGIVTIDSNIVYSFHNYNPNSSISYGELYSIYILLTEFVPLLKGTKHRLTLYTDSEYSFKSINIWCKNWFKKAKQGIWYSSSGKQVAYQLMIEEILDIIRNNNVQIKHVSCGHLEVLQPKMVSKAAWNKSIKKCRKTFYRNNGYYITNEEAKSHIFYNNICDQIAKEGLERGKVGVLSCERKRKSFKKYIT